MQIFNFYIPPARLWYHVIASFIVLPVFLILFFIPGINIPIFIILSILSYPFGVILSILTPEEFIEKHFTFVFSMLGPSDFLGWFMLILYLLFVFNYIVYRYTRRRY